ncbi:hypothetical protein GCM10010176_105290 [Nonomuraea spiralis]|nr:hypothetical protein GCM10010176_105290 [Nonomuraea spiralis]
MGDSASGASGWWTYRAICTSPAVMTRDLSSSRTVSVVSGMVRVLLLESGDVGGFSRHTRAPASRAAIIASRCGTGGIGVAPSDEQ